MYVCWAVKGGVGTSVVAAGLALVIARDRPSVLVDLVGDQPPLLGITEGTGSGVGEWLAADADGDALRRVEAPVTDRCRLLARGAGPLAPRLDRLAAVLAGRSRPVVVDAGVVQPAVTLAALFDRADHRLLVTRACYLALRRVRDVPLQATGVVLVREPGRALGRADVEAVAGVPVVADVAWDPAVARAVDAGLLATRLPRALARSLRAALS